jgi:hypothetical protein
MAVLALMTGSAHPHGGGLSGIALYRVIAERAGQRHGVPPELVEAVMRIESGYRVEARGRDGEVGLMQVLPSTAAMLGFRGQLDELADPATNIDLGARYLAGAWRLSGGDVCTAGMKYRAGHGETEFSPRSITYCSRLKQNLIVGEDGSFRLTPYRATVSASASAGRKRCFRRVVQAGARFGQCITREDLAARGLMRKPRS